MWAGARGRTCGAFRLLRVQSATTLALHQEQGLVLQEAMFTGMPVLTTLTPG